MDGLSSTTRTGKNTELVPGHLSPKTGGVHFVLALRRAQMVCQIPCESLFPGTVLMAWDKDDHLLVFFSFFQISCSAYSSARLLLRAGVSISLWNSTGNHRSTDTGITTPASARQVPISSSSFDRDIDRWSASCLPDADK